MSYLLHLLVMFNVYLALAYALNLTVGFAGLLSLCHAAFYGLGAYAYVILLQQAGAPQLVALVGAVAFNIALAIPIGWISVRFRGDLFLFVTLGFQMIVFVTLYNWVALTNGPYGIAAIPRPEFLGFRIDSPAGYLALALLMNALLLALLFRLYRSPFGLMLKALREDEVAAESLGLDRHLIFFQAFVISAAFAAAPGAFYASYVTYIDPTSFTLNESIFLLAILLLGGAGNRLGPFAGAAVMVLLPELLRFAGLPDDTAHHLRQILYGAALALLMYFRPFGIAGEFKPG